MLLLLLLLLLLLGLSLLLEIALALFALVEVVRLLVVGRVVRPVATVLSLGRRVARSVVVLVLLLEVRVRVHERLIRLDLLFYFVLLVLNKKRITREKLIKFET